MATAAGQGSKCVYEPEVWRREAALIPAQAALVVIDVQNFCVHRKGAGAPPASESYFWDRVERVALPNLQTLIATCREQGVEVIYTTIESLTKDGRDRSLDYKISGFNVPKGDWNGKVLDEVAPQDDEIVLPKTSCSVFISTHIHYLLQNMRKTQVVLCGGLTDQCVESAVRDFCDANYLVTLVPDACYTFTAERHDRTLTTIKGFCRQRTVAQLQQELAHNVPSTRLAAPSSQSPSSPSQPSSSSSSASWRAAPFPTAPCVTQQIFQTLALALAFGLGLCCGAWLSRLEFKKQ